jgi:hypothetical protein
MVHLDEMLAEPKACIGIDELDLHEATSFAP